jgi:Fe2+ or Zn2+ uptake regulation protein
MLKEVTLLEKLEEIGFPPLKLESTSIVNLSNYPKAKYYPDTILKLVWQEQSNSFITELVPIATPQNLFLGEQKLKEYFSDSSVKKEQYYPLILTTYLKPTELERLANNGISAIDLCGNGVIQIPGKWFIHRSGAKNLFPSSSPIKNIFIGTSSLVARVFFSQDSFSSVNEVLDQILLRKGQITLPTVSKVLKTLQDELLVTKTQSKEIKLFDPKKLLSSLADNYQKPVIKRRLIGKVADLNNVLFQLANKAKEKEIDVVGVNPSFYAVMPTQSYTKIYTSNLEKLLAGVKFTQTNRFPNIEFNETSEPTVYFDSRRQDSFYWTPPLQTYLELNVGDKREQETAEQIANDLLALKYIEKKK